MDPGFSDMKPIESKSKPSYSVPASRGDNADIPAPPCSTDVYARSQLSDPCPVGAQLRYTPVTENLFPDEGEEFLVKPGVATRVIDETGESQVESKTLCSLQDAVVPVMDSMSATHHQTSSSGNTLPTSCNGLTHAASEQTAQNELTSGYNTGSVFPMTWHAFREEKIPPVRGPLSDIVLSAFPGGAPTSISECPLEPPATSPVWDPYRVTLRAVPSPRRRVTFLLPPDSKDRENGAFPKLKKKRRSHSRGKNGGTTRRNRRPSYGLEPLPLP